MSIEIVKLARIHDLLLKIDQDLSERRRQEGCAYCGSKLHCGNFPRKPRGCPDSARAGYSKRFSFNCSLCDKRATPPSVRFIGRRLYVSAVLALVCPRGPARHSWLCRELGVAAVTVKRWRYWWQESFAMTKFWSLRRADFIPPLDSATLPSSAVERFRAADHGERLVKFLRFLMSCPCCLT